ncbi:MAG: alkene reductase [Deltaproteobacteria bacterium]|nr:alkene reductase [Nannocystaceae bacterium]
MTSLLDPVTLGAFSLRNRIVMAPLTRSRATGADGRTPNALMREYYVQRASAGLIISEATAVTPRGVGYANTPGIWSDAHVEGWRSITDAVHRAGGTMLLQLWHVGRISHPLFLDGALPVAPSAIAPLGNVSLVRPETSHVVPHALELAEIAAVIGAYRTGAANAQRAGFDGVEIHGANGYLLDQFLQDGSNHRTDAYGGSIENRARLMLEVTDAVVSVWGADRVGMHLAPRGDSHSMGDSDLPATFGHVARELGRRQIAFLCTREHEAPDSIAPALKRAFGGRFIANERFTPATAAASVERGDADAVAFGKAFIANPDLVERIHVGAELERADAKTFYVGGPEGYTSYPTMTAAARTA